MSEPELKTLKACPFCLCPDIRVTPLRFSCAGCYCEGPTEKAGATWDACRTTDKVNNLWNARPTEDAVVEQIAAWLDNQGYILAAQAVTAGAWKGGK